MLSRSEATDNDLALLNMVPGPGSVKKELMGVRSVLMRRAEEEEGRRVVRWEM